MKAHKLIRNMKHFAKGHGSSVLTVVAMVGVAVTAYLAAKAAPGAVADIDDATEDLAEEEGKRFDEVKLPKGELIKILFRAYWKAILAGVITCGLIFSSHLICLKQIGDWAAAYNVASAAHNTFEEKVKKEVGEETFEKVRRQANEEEAKKVYESHESDLSCCIEETGEGDQLFYDAMIGRLFKSSRESLRAACNNLNANAINGFGYVSLNDFYDEACLKEVEVGDIMTWNIESKNDLIELDLTDTGLTDDGRSYIVMDFARRPHGMNRW